MVHDVIQPSYTYNHKLFSLKRKYHNLLACATWTEEKHHSTCGDLGDKRWGKGDEDDGVKRRRRTNEEYFNIMLESREEGSTISVDYGL